MTHSRIIGTVTPGLASSPERQFWMAGLEDDVRHVSTMLYRVWMRPLPARSMGRSLFFTADHSPNLENATRSGSPDSARVVASTETWGCHDGEALRGFCVMGGTPEYASRTAAWTTFLHVIQSSAGSFWRWH